MRNVVNIRARSLYRQLRLTLTQEAGGRVSYSISAKGLNDAWSERSVLIRDHFRLDEPLETTEDVIRCLLICLNEQLLPESHND